MEITPPGLRRMRRVATGLLLGMAALYVAARSFAPYAGAWIEYVRAFAEAAMVGALADWFAVVALFRHPLRIPFPHTAVIPRNKDRIGDSLGRFIATHFLTAEVVRPRLAQLDMAGIAGRWLVAQSQRVAESIAEQIPRLLALVDDEAVFRFLRAQLATQLPRIEVAPLAGRVLAILTEGDRHRALLGGALRLLDEWMTQQRDWLWQQVRDEIRLPELPGIAAIKDKLADFAADKFVNKITRLVHEVRTDPAHPFHARFREVLQQQIVALQESPAYRAKGEEIMRQIVEHPALAQYAREVWQGLERWIASDLAAPASKIREHARLLAEGIGRALAENAEFRDRLNAALRQGIETFVVRHRHEAENLIRETVAKWEAEDVCANLEREVGADLQYIRINGTLVGGSVGVAIHFASRLFWPG